MLPSEELYRTLQVDASASAQQIKQSFHRLARQYHPDKGGESSVFRKLENAYSILGNLESRRVYDAEREKNSRLCFEAVTLEEMARNGDGEYEYHCRCGDTLSMPADTPLDGKEVILSCTSCSLGIRVIMRMQECVQKIEATP